MTLDGGNETVTFQASLELGNREKYAGPTSGLYGGCRKVATPIQASRRPQRRQCGLERCRGGAFNDRHSPVVSISSSVKALKDFVEHSVVRLSLVSEGTCGSTFQAGYSFLCCIFQVCSGSDGQPTGTQDVPCFINIGSFQPHHQRHIEVD